MAEKKLCIDELAEFDHILIYGAGSHGKRMINYFNNKGFDRSKLILWDKNFAEIGVIFNCAVTEPQFESFDDRHIPIIIALDWHVNENAIREVRRAFEQNGFTNFVDLADIHDIYSPRIMRVRDFEKIISENNLYECEYQNDMDFSEFTPKIKALAYYLPQFHDIPENDKWWGKGFTEWTNTRKAKPYFEGHYQPREPHNDLGYYDLTDVATIKKQAEIAKKHGIYGWCIYYYWFSGKKLLERPIDILLAHKDIDIHFCLMWANESWTRQWIGNNSIMLVEQKYLNNDPMRFICDLKKYVDDPRYIRIDGKPLIMIYQPQNVPDPHIVIARWREQAAHLGIGDLHVLINCREYTPRMLGLETIVDGAAAYSFHVPIYSRIVNFVKNNAGETEYGRIIDYEEYTDAYVNFVKNDKVFKPFYRACFSCWDNTPRYDRTQNEFFSCNYNFSLRKFYEMTSVNVEEAEEMKKEFIFIFSWNEWCEGAYIEPDQKYGYAVINTLAKAICGLPFDYHV